jgi:TetR/AcrR family transcriptional repressor of nem operon
MGHSQADKARTHARIVEIAARRLREDGLQGVGVAELMQEAGLTVGGFYKHFGSRDDLVAEALGACFAQSEDAIDRQAGKGERTLASVADWYLTPEHRDDKGAGCPFAALAPDLARADKRTRTLATAEIRTRLARLAGLAVARDGPPIGRARAILAYSALIGALSLARAVDDAALSREILAAAAATLKTALAADARPGSGKLQRKTRGGGRKSLRSVHAALARRRTPALP